MKKIESKFKCLSYQCTKHITLYTRPIMTMVYTFLADNLTPDIAERICMDVTRFNFQPVLQAIPPASARMSRLWFLHESIREAVRQEHQALVEKYGLKNDERFGPLYDRLHKLAIYLTGDVTDTTITEDSLFVNIMDSLETEFGEITKFSDFVHDKIVDYYDDFVCEQEYYAENPRDPLSDDDD